MKEETLERLVKSVDQVLLGQWDQVDVLVKKAPREIKVGRDFLEVQV